MNLKIEKEGQPVVFKCFAEWSSISLELSIFIYTVSSENTRKLLIGIKHWNNDFTLCPTDFCNILFWQFIPLN